MGPMYMCMKTKMNSPKNFLVLDRQKSIRMRESYTISSISEKHLLG